MKSFLAENVDLMVEISEKIKAEVGITEVDGNADLAGTEFEDEDIDA